MKNLASFLIAVCCLLFMPTVAFAATYTVDSNGDETDTAIGLGGCETALEACTLRAAIEESNASVGDRDIISFAVSFDGQPGDTIALGSPLPAIADSVHVDGDRGRQCETYSGPAGPCAEINGPTAGSAFTIEDDDIEIEGLSITGVGGAAIAVVDESEGFEARNNWLGVGLDGAGGKAYVNDQGIFIGPGSDGAVIGGLTAEARNVIANSDQEGIDIEGASTTVIQGNYFGITPKAKGIFEARNHKNVEVTDSTAGGGFKAENTEIGTMIGDEEIATKACDGGCNVLSGADFSAIDLNGESGGNEAPASGPTVVHGNYLGFNAKGQAGFVSGKYAIHVGAADDTLIGGSHDGDANYITNCAYAVYLRDGDGLVAQNNVIGVGPAGTPDEFSAPFAAGFFVSSPGSPEQVLILGNRVRTYLGAGVEVQFGGAAIIDNMIEGGGEGVRTWSQPGLGKGSLIEGNVIEDTYTGIWIRDDNNEVLGNGIFGSRGVGISITNGSEGSATGNRVGGDQHADENTISGSTGRAIEIISESESSADNKNEVARNNGEENGGAFIFLAGNANEGIKPPIFDAANETSASGSGAEAGANIRVFRKTSAKSGELESFLGEATADGSGDWEVTFSNSIPGGTIVAATQTSVGRSTSKLAVATVPKPPIVIVDPVDKSGNEKGSDSDRGEVCLRIGGKGCEIGPLHPGPPRTTILGAPKARTHAASVEFEFSSSELGSSFECRLDRKRFKRCKSPKRYNDLKPGKHVFRVRAIDKDGNVDATPAMKKFEVLGS